MMPGRQVCDGAQSTGAAGCRLRGPTLRTVEMDVELLDRLREGDEEAFLVLIGRYQQPMLRLARSMVSSQAVAEEAVQDTWMGVVRGINNFEGRSSFKTWLFRILGDRTRSAGAKELTSVPIEDAPPSIRDGSMPKGSGRIR